MATRRAHPIRGRFERLRGQIRNFLTSNAGLMRWLVDADEVPLVEAVLAAECHEDGELRGFFFRDEQAFEHPTAHGHAIRGTFLAQYAAASRALPIGTAAWVPPVPSAHTSDAIALATTLGSFLSHYRAHFENVVLVLWPESVVDIGAYLHWLQSLLHAAATTSVRIIVIDDKRTAALAPLARAEPFLIRSVEAALDMPAAIIELAQLSGGPTPGDQFREMFARASSVGAQGDVAKGVAVAGQAAALAHTQGWSGLATAADFLAGSLMLSAGSALEGIERFRAAEGHADSALAQKDPSGPRLKVSARLAVCAALFAHRGYAHAARYYEGTIPWIEAVPDPRLELEAWRMASYCHELVADMGSAWETGLRALAVARRMSPAERSLSTLREAGEGMLRITQRHGYAHYGNGIGEQMVAMLGADWRSAPGLSPRIGER